MAYIAAGDIRVLHAWHNFSSLIQRDIRSIVNPNQANFEGIGKATPW